MGPMMFLLLMVGCSGGDETPFGVDVVAEDAWISGVTSVSVAMLFGGVSSEGTLHFVADDGGEYEYPVSLDGSTLGAVIDVSFDPIPNRIDLELPGPVPANDLLGRYKGTTGSAVVGFGVGTRHLENRAGVVIDETQFNMGVGILAGWEWMNLEVRD